MKGIERRLLPDGRTLYEIHGCECHTSATIWKEGSGFRSIGCTCLGRVYQLPGESIDDLAVRWQRKIRNEQITAVAFVSLVVGLALLAALAVAWWLP